MVMLWFKSLVWISHSRGSLISVLIMKLDWLWMIFCIPSKLTKKSINKSKLNLLFQLEVFTCQKLTCVTFWTLKGPIRPKVRLVELPIWHLDNDLMIQHLCSKLSISRWVIWHSVTQLNLGDQYSGTAFLVFLSMRPVLGIDFVYLDYFN